MGIFNLLSALQPVGAKPWEPSRPVPKDNIFIPGLGDLSNSPKPATDPALTGTIADAALLAPRLRALSIAQNDLESLSMARRQEALALRTRQQAEMIKAWAAAEHAQSKLPAASELEDKDEALPGQYSKESPTPWPTRLSPEEESRPTADLQRLAKENQILKHHLYKMEHELKRVTAAYQQLARHVQETRANEQRARGLQQRMPGFGYQLSPESDYSGNDYDDYRYGNEEFEGADEPPDPFEALKSRHLGVMKSGNPSGSGYALPSSPPANWPGASF